MFSTYHRMGKPCSKIRKSSDDLLLGFCGFEVFRGAPVRPPDSLYPKP